MHKYRYISPSPSYSKRAIISHFCCAVLDKNLHDATIIISTPFHPAYMTRERIAASPKLKLLLTAGIGSDHVDLKAAAERGITVAEVPGVVTSLQFACQFF